MGLRAPVPPPVGRSGADPAMPTAVQSSPGVGRVLHERDRLYGARRRDAVLDAVVAGTPLLGICRAFSYFFERGNEGVPADEGCRGRQRLRAG